jgi:hypothetical protein
MNTKATLYLDPKVYRALKVKAAKSDKTVSETANEILGGAMGFAVGDGPEAPKVTLEFEGKFGLPLVKGLNFPKDFVFRREDIYD